MTYASPSSPISSIAQLVGMTSGTASAGKSYYLTRDLIVDGSGGYALPLMSKNPPGYFSLDGQGHKITVTVGSGTSPNNLFLGFADGYTLQNITFDLQVNDLEILGSNTTVGLANNITILTSTGAGFSGTFCPRGGKIGIVHGVLAKAPNSQNVCCQALGITNTQNQNVLCNAVPTQLTGDSVGCQL